MIGIADLTRVGNEEETQESNHSCIRIMEIIMTGSKEEVINVMHRMWTIVAVLGLTTRGVTVITNIATTIIIIINTTHTGQPTHSKIIPVSQMVEEVVTLKDTLPTIDKTVTKIIEIQVETQRHNGVKGTTTVENRKDVILPATEAAMQSFNIIQR